MSKIPLSYRIIKQCNVSCDEEGISFIDTKLDCMMQEGTIVLDQKKKKQHIQSVDDIRDEIRRNLFMETDKERQRIIEMAVEEGESLRNKAKEQGYEAGFQLGYGEGYKEGMTKAEEEGTILKNNAVSLIEQAERNVSEYFLENRVNIIQLAADMAESITHSTINTSSENIVMLLKPILRKYGKKENITITCHPGNKDFINTNLDEMKKLCPDARFIILEDENLEINGCVVENEHQIVDLQIKKQINAMLEEMKNLR